MGELITGSFPEVDIYDPDVQYSAIPPGGDERGTAYRMRIDTCAEGESINGVFALLLRYSKNGFDYVQAIPNILKSFPCCTTAGELELCPGGHSLVMTKDCDGDGSLDSGDRAELRLNIRNSTSAFAGVIDPDIWLECSCGGLMVDCGRNESIRYPDMPNDGSCHLPERSTSSWGIEAPKNFTGTCEVSVKYIYDGETTAAVSKDTYTIAVGPQAWFGVVPRQYDFGTANNNTTVTIGTTEADRVLIRNSGTASLEVTGIDVLFPTDKISGVTVSALIEPLMPMPWHLSPGQDLQVVIHIETSTGKGKVSPPISVRFITDACVREDRDTIYISGIVGDTPEPICLGIPTFVDYSRGLDVSGDMIVWLDTRDGEDIYGYNVATRAEIPIAVDSNQHGDPRVSGNLVAWVQECNPPDYRCDVWARLLPDGEPFPVANSPAHERLVGVDNGIVAFSRVYGEVIIGNPLNSPRSLRNLYLFDTSDGFETALTEFSQNGTNPLGSVDSRNFDFGGGLLAWTEWQATWDGSRWQSRNLGTKVYKPANQQSWHLPPTPIDNISANDGYVVWADRSQSDEQIFKWQNGVATQITFDEEDHEFPEVGLPCVVYKSSAFSSPQPLLCHNLDTGTVTSLVTPEAHILDRWRIDDGRLVYRRLGENRDICYIQMPCGECDGNDACPDDGNACTTELCRNTCCVSEPDCRSDADCDDGDWCNGAETCSPSGCCEASAEVQCADLARPYCDETARTCDECQDDAHCDNDGNDCTDEVCVEKNCESVNKLADAPCGDTTDTNCDKPDTCDGAGTCRVNYEPPTTNCRLDAGECDVPEFCDGVGNCPENGFEPVTTSCGDPADTVCDNPDTCDGEGSCLSNYEQPSTMCREALPICDVAEFCDGAGNCPDDELSPLGTACGDSTVTDCDRADGCDGLGTCLDNHEPDGTLCPDSLFCNGAEACESGECAAGEPPSCVATCTEECGGCACQSTADCPDDGLTCTVGSCNLVTGCCGEPVIDAGHCLIDGVCYVDGAVNPVNSCQFCDSATDDSSWSTKPDGDDCDDDNICTSDDTCSGGACTGTAIPGCPTCVPNCAGKACGPDGCPNGSCGTCIDDGDFCTVEACQGGACVVSGSPCEDGEACCEETDSCEAECCNDADCDDGAFCNGVEQCVAGTCEAGTPQCAADEACCENSDSCVAECCADDDCGDCEQCSNGACMSECDSDQDCDDGFCVRSCARDDACVGRMRCLAQECTRLAFATPTDEVGEPVRPSCNANSDCEDSTKICVDGVCLLPCAADADCGDEESCEDGFCWEACTNTAQCPEGQFCDDGGACRVDCTNDSDCDDNVFCNGFEVCDLSTGRCADGTLPCAGNCESCSEDAGECLVSTSCACNGGPCGAGVGTAMILLMTMFVRIRLFSSRARRRRRG